MMALQSPLTIPEAFGSLAIAIAISFIFEHQQVEPPNAERLFRADHLSSDHPAH